MSCLVRAWEVAALVPVALVQAWEVAGMVWGVAAVPLSHARETFVALAWVQPALPLQRVRTSLFPPSHRVPRP